MTQYEKLVKACNEFLWVHMYPQTGGRDLPNAYQVRDLVRTFFAGCLEMCISSPNVTWGKENARAIVEHYRPMVDEAWMPGPEFYPPLPRSN